MLKLGIKILLLFFVVTSAYTELFFHLSSTPTYPNHLTFLRALSHNVKNSGQKSEKRGLGLYLSVWGLVVGTMRKMGERKPKRLDDDLWFEL